MSAPLDFSSVGAKKPTRPAPKKKAPKRRLPGLGTPRARIVAAALVAVALAIAGFVAFGRSDTSPSAEAEKMARYCGAALEFDRLVPYIPPGAETVDTSAKTMSRLVGRLDGVLAQMKADAPSGIRSDVHAAIAALEEAAAGKPAGVRSASFREQRQRISGYGQSDCIGEPADVGF